MKKILALIFFSTIILSCGNVNKIDFKEVEHIFIDYDLNEANNYKSEIDARICVKTKLGEIIPIESKKSIQTSSNVKFNLSHETIKVISAPKDFNDSLIVVDLKIIKKNGKYISSKDTIVLNYRKGLALGHNGANGANGAAGSNGGTALLFRFGKDGGNGVHGGNGAHGDNFTIHIWKHLDFYLIQVNNTTQRYTNNYQILGLHPFELSSNGGRAGNGGNGGNGGDGKDGETTEKKSKSAGSGGDAGLGGSGGFGGNGGNITCLIHTNAQEFRSQIQLSAKPGRGGTNGTTGSPGKAGQPLEGHSQPEDGRLGADGNSGQSGQNGIISISVENFELK